jgi:V8-like Glu-specific endopeptidase
MTAVGSMIAAGLLLTPTGDAAEAGLQAVTSVADPTVGPLFENGLATGHSCTASVLNAGRDLLLTAAHCVTGTGAGVQFAPGYDGTSGDPTPYGVWTVTRTYVPTPWLQDQDADHDYAILQVADLDVDGRA